MNAELRKKNREITWRDWKALEWIGRQYGVRSDVFAVLMGRLNDGPPLSERSKREQIERWQDLGLVVTERMARRLWLTPTKYGLGVAGLKPSWRWDFPASRLDHTHAVAVMRLAWEGLYGREAWLHSDRDLKDDIQEDEARPDGIVVKPGNGEPDQIIWIEVELTMKTTARLQKKLKALAKAKCPMVAYVTTERQQKNLENGILRASEDLDLKGMKIQIDTLPKVEGVRPGDVWS